MVALKIVQCLLHTQARAITNEGMSSELCMEVYTNLDFGVCLNTRRSILGEDVILAKGATSCHSRIEEVTKLSVSETVYVTLSEQLEKVNVSG